MNLAPPKFGNPPVRWKQLPRWLQGLRVIAVMAMACGALVLTGISILEPRVLASPKVPMGQNIHPVTYKSATFFLTDPLYKIWHALDLAILPVLVTAFVLAFAGNTFEHRIKKRLWGAAIDEMVARDAGTNAGPD